MKVVRKMHQLSSETKINHLEFYIKSYNQELKIYINNSRSAFKNIDFELDFEVVRAKVGRQVIYEIVVN